MWRGWLGDAQVARLAAIADTRSRREASGGRDEQAGRAVALPGLCQTLFRSLQGARSASQHHGQMASSPAPDENDGAAVPPEEERGRTGDFKENFKAIVEAALPDEVKGKGLPI